MRNIERDETSLLLTVPDVADLLRTTPKAVYVMVARGQVPGVIRLGRRLLFRRAALLNWLDHKSRVVAKKELGDERES